MVSLNQLRSGLRRCRVEREWTQDELAEAAGVGTKVVHMTESVRKYPGYEPGLDTFRKLLAGLQITFTAFCARVEGADALSNEWKPLVAAGLPLPPLNPLPKSPRIPVPPTGLQRKSTPAKYQAARRKQERTSRVES